MNMKGFTLIEAMVAITIVTLSIAGPLYTASRAIVAAENARDQLIASYLAQEGIEYVRMMRDDEYLASYQTGGAGISSTAWNNFLNDQSPPDVFSILQCRAPKICMVPDTVAFFLPHSFWTVPFFPPSKNNPPAQTGEDLLSCQMGMQQNINFHPIIRFPAFH